jgi:dTDP-4-amino-4,6-dideoxygalactose transaminase
MKKTLTRRSFVKRTSAALAAAAAATKTPNLLAANTRAGADKLALLGGTPVRSKPFSQVWPIFDHREEDALMEALRSRDWCCLRGHVVYDFQKTFASAMNAGQATLTNGGTTALRASLHSLGIGAGDEVITTPHTFVATINVITNAHALPVFVDIDPDTGCIDADLIEDAITENTRAILPVHLAGFPVDIEKIMAIADKHNIPVVEDACQSVFAEVNGKMVGTFGATGCISFQEWKSLVAGEGGAILCSDNDLMRRCTAFINNGRDPLGQKSGYPYPGSNHRMTEFQAAVLTQQYKRFLIQAATRRENGAYLETELTKIPGLFPRKRYNPDTKFTYVRFELDYDRKRFDNVSAATFAKALRAEGIPISGGPRRYGGGCHKEGMLEEHLNSRGFKNVFSKARLAKYRESLKLPVMDNLTANNRQMLHADSKIPFLGTKKEMNQIITAFKKVAANTQKLAKA